MDQYIEITEYTREGETVERDLHLVGCAYGGSSSSPPDE